MGVIISVSLLFCQVQIILIVKLNLIHAFITTNFGLKSENTLFPKSEFSQKGHFNLTSDEFVSQRSHKNAFSFNFMMKSQTERSYPGAFDRQHLGTMNNKGSGRFAQHGYEKHVDRALLFIF